MAQDTVESLHERLRDMQSTFNAWFDQKKLTREEIGPAMLDAARGYLRVSRNGGMPRELSDTIEGVIADMIRLDYLTAPVTQYLMTKEQEKPNG